MEKLPAKCRRERRNLQLEVNFFCIVNGNANSSARRQCLCRLSFEFEFNLEFIGTSVFLKKVSNGQIFTGSKFVLKTSLQCNSIDTTPDFSLTRNLKVANKDLRHLIGS